MKLKKKYGIKREGKCNFFSYIFIISDFTNLFDFFRDAQDSKDLEESKVLAFK